MVVKTLTCSLKPTPEQAKELLRLMKVFNAACDFASEVAFREKAFRRTALHHLTYYDIRSRFGLPSQLAVRAIAKVVDAYKLDRNVQRTFNPHGAVTFDSRVLRLLGVSVVSITLLESRETIRLSIGGYHADRLRGAVLGETDLCYQKDQNRFRLHFALKFPDPPEIETEGVLGIDLGIVQIATDSEGEAFSGEATKAVRRRYKRLRAGLQKCGTKSAKRHLKRIRKRQSRYHRNENHRISKRIVRKAKDSRKALALEDLTGIRERGNGFHREMRWLLGGWSFHQLQAFFSYKAKEAGLPVYFVEARNTSRTCSKCGHCEKANRKSQEHFCCLHCGFEINADFNAALNIEARANVHLPMVSNLAA